jgi:hypothetical protein
MERHRMTADAAFGYLSQASQDVNMKLTAVAQHLVETGELRVVPRAVTRAVSLAIGSGRPPAIVPSLRRVSPDRQQELTAFGPGLRRLDLCARGSTDRYGQQ